ncbi:MAG: alpha/beta fold hydrolase [Pyrinomonadaceae bacterium]|nr:alpha/beta fold hydrolase [Pyrinomonadaceae bacterium]
MSNAKYPIILAHGIARFDFLLNYFTKTFDALGLNLVPANDGLHYFKGIASYLRGHGFDVYHSSVGFAAGVEQRAQDLRDEVNKVLSLKNQEKVHIIGHSMGGLDARHMIVNHDMAAKVSSLTTIGTPHLGTSFADWALAHQGDEFIKIIGNVIDLAGFRDLAQGACNSFNEQAREQEASNSVVYRAYAASQKQKLVFTPLQKSWDIINDSEGDNDGLVSVTSQHWQSQVVTAQGTAKHIEQKLFPVGADHLNEIGWWDLNEMREINWWKTSIVTAIRDYELRIKKVYLDIATHL